MTKKKKPAGGPLSAAACNARMEHQRELHKTRNAWTPYSAYKLKSGFYEIRNNDGAILAAAVLPSQAPLFVLAPEMAEALQSILELIDLTHGATPADPAKVNEFHREAATARALLARLPVQS